MKKGWLLAFFDKPTEADQVWRSLRKKTNHPLVLVTKLADGRIQARDSFP